MSDLKLGYGRTSGLPEGVEAAWGARLIWPNDLLHDRQSIAGSDEQRRELADWLNGGPLMAARAAALRMSEQRTLAPSDIGEVILYSDDVGKVVGSPQGSHGYLYVAAWMHAHVPPMLHNFADSHEAYDMSQSSDAIRDGDVLRCDDGVVGFLVGAWPVAISTERGAFHRLSDESDLRLNGRDYTRSAELAKQQL